LRIETKNIDLTRETSKKENLKVKQPSFSPLGVRNFEKKKKPISFFWLYGAAAFFSFFLVVSTQLFKRWVWRI